MNYRIRPVRPAPLWRGDEFTPGMFGSRWPGNYEPTVLAAWRDGNRTKVSHESGDGRGGSYVDAASCENRAVQVAGKTGTNAGMRTADGCGAGRDVTRRTPASHLDKSERSHSGRTGPVVPAPTASSRRTE